MRYLRINARAHPYSISSAISSAARGTVSAVLPEPGVNGAQSHPTDSANRRADGRFVPGNSAAVKHGVYATQREVSADARQSIHDFAAGVIADLGGDLELSAIERGMVENLRDLELVKRMFVSHLATKGLFTPKGNTRRCFEHYLMTLSAWHRTATTLGLKRRTRYVDPYEALRIAVDEANKTP
jgi:hypothetical protein